MAVESSGIEFRTGYSLLPRRSRRNQTRITFKGRNETTDMSNLSGGGDLEFSEMELTKIDADVLPRMKIFIANESSNGEHFVTHLKQIKDILERVVLTCMDGLSNTHINNIYNIITEKLVSYLPRIKQSQKEMALLLIDILCLLGPLKIDSSLTFPEVFASCLLYFQPELDWGDIYNEVMGRLCHFVLPNCLVRSPYRQCMCLSSVLMMVLETCSSTKHHLLLIDTLMILKRDVCMDILTVITYGTHTVRSKALDLLLHYWPIPIPEFPIHSHIMYGEWTMPSCENSTCRHRNNIATTLCLDVACAVQHKAPNSTRLYLLLCPDCDSTIHSGEDTHQRLKLPMPLREIKPNCEFQRICSGKENKVNKAVVTCYDETCTAIQNGQPIRMCLSCHTKQHKDLNDPAHIYQVGIPDPWVYDNMSSSSTMLEAVSKLIESIPTISETPQRVGTTPRLSTPHRPKPTHIMQMDIEISKKGLWLLSHYCTPTTEVRSNQQEWLVHLLALVLEWLQSYYDILQQAIVKVEEQLTSAGVAAVAAGAEGQEWVDSGYYEFEKIFSNYSEVTTLIDSHVLYWVRSVCATNRASMVEVLRPDIRGCAQVGRMWNKSHDSIARYKRTLMVIYRLNCFHRQGKLDSFAEVFNVVMPMWMDKLVDLRTEPGRMESLQDQFRLIFSYNKHEQGMRTFNFIWEKFRSEGNEGRQKGLFWLQDLTRLNIPIPYLPHMFESALKENHSKFQKMPTLDSAGSSFDLEVRVKRESLENTSGSESEPHLLSHSSLEQADTQILVNLNSSLARYILMLDIWLCQLTQLNVPTLELSVFLNNLIKMLRKMWGSSHDHRESSNVCYLCHGIAIWFSLVTRLLEEYAKLEQRESSAGEEFEEVVSPPHHRLSARSDKPRQIIPTPQGRTRVSASDSYEQPQQVAGQLRKQSADLDNKPPQKEKEVKKFGIQGGLQALHAGGQNLEEFEFYQLQGSPHHRRKIAQVQSHSQFQVLTDSKLGLAKGSQRDGHGGGETTPTIYIVFQLCISKLTKAKLQPDSLLKLVTCLSVLVHEWRVLDINEDQETVCRDVTQLFDILWKSLETISSNSARACVDLLLECAKYLANAKLEHRKKFRSVKKQHAGAHFQVDISDTESEGDDREREVEEELIEEEMLWETVENGLSSGRWSVRFRAAESFTMIVQFMRKPGLSETDILSLHSKVQASLAHGFCLLVQLLMDKNSNVCARAKYLISSIKESSLEAMKLYLKNFFYEYPMYRTEVLNTFSILDSSLPELGFLSVDVLSNLLRIATRYIDSSEARVRTSEPERADISLTPKKKASDASLLSGDPSPRVSTQTVLRLDEDPFKLKITEKLLSLLLRHIANPRVDMTESMKRNQAHGQRFRKGGTVKTRRITPSSHREYLLRTLRGTIFHDLNCLPQDIRRSPVFEVFLNHIFPVLDHNIEFGQTKGMLPFILKILCFCAAPNQTDYLQLKLEDRLRDPHSPPKGCTYSLSSLPPHLRAPWLRVFFVILYKYIHDYSEVDPRSHYQGLEMLTLCQWCLQITLNTLESEGHECSFLSDSPAKKPSLQRQLTMDSFTNSLLESVTGEIPSVNIVGDSTSSRFVKAKSRDVLSPVREDEEVRSKPSTAGPSERGVQSESTERADSGSEQEEPLPGMCLACNKPTNEYTEEVVALAVVALGTCCHRLPHTVSGYLVSRIIPAVARVVIPGSFSWQSTKITAEPPPGSAMAVAKHILASILTQFGDRRLFLFVFGMDYGKKSQTVFTALAHGVLGMEVEATTEGGDGDTDGGISEGTVVKYFLEDAVSSIRDVHPHSLVNLATYIEILEQIQESPSSSIKLTKDLLLWDSFCKKLKSNPDVLRNKKAMHAFLRVIIALFRNSLEYPTPPNLGSYHAHAVQSISQSLMSIIEFALYNVYIPLGGLVEVGALWYRLFQQHSHREAEKLIKLYVSELRKALKARGYSENCPRPDNFLGLIQVLLLEESGYLGYVDGLTPKKCFAPDLKNDYETHTLPVISALQWDFVDILDYLSARDITSTEFLPQLKLSLAQLIALRVEHGRSPPTDRLKRLVAGDPRSLLPAPTTFRSTVIHVLQPRWEDYIKAIHVLSWLLLGAMCHNYVDAIAVEMEMEGSVSGQCRLLESLNQNLEEVTKGMLTLVSGVLQRIAVAPDENFGYIYLTFLFASIWTVYMELYAKDSTALIVQFWQKFMGRLTHLMSEDMSENYRVEVVETLNKFVVIRIKEINLSCYAMLVPLWREVTISVAHTNLEFPDVKDAQSTSVDKWFKESLKELVTLEQEWQTDTPTY